MSNAETRLLGFIAVHKCWDAAELGEGQKTHKQGCFQLALHSSTAAAGVHMVLGFVAVHLCWVAAELSEGQKPIGAIAMTSKAVVN